MSSAWFGNAMRQEAQQLSQTFSSTLTFTVTFQAVTTLVEQNNRSAPILMVAVAAVVLISVALKGALNDLAEKQKLKALNRLVDTTLTVSTQFLSNLLAVAAREIFFDVATVWWILLFSAFAVLLVDSAASR